jgi:hypothetical protein
MPINDLALQDIAELGQEKLKLVKLPQARFRRKRREQRKRKALYDDLYKSEMNGQGRGNYRNAMQRLQNAAPMNTVANK